MLRSQGVTKDKYLVKLRLFSQNAGAFASKVSNEEECFGPKYILVQLCIGEHVNVFLIH